MPEKRPASASKLSLRSVLGIRRLPRRLRWLRGGGGVAIFAALLTAVMAAPVLYAPGSRIFGSEIVGRHEAPFIVAYQYHHQQGSRLFTQPATDYVGRAIASVVGDGVIAVTALVLISFPLAALFAYLFAFRLSGSRPVSWLAGLSYAFAPFHMAQSAYHPHGSQTQWLPLYLLALWLGLERWSPARGALLAVATTLVVLSNYYYGLIAAVLTPVALLAFWLAQDWRRASAFRHLGLTVGSLGAISAFGVAYVLRMAPKVLEDPDTLAWPRQDLLLYGARWWSYFVPPVGHPLFGNWSQAFWERQGLGGLLEQQLTVGFGFLVLSVIALAAYGRRRSSKELAVVPALGVVAATAWFFSLAPEPNSTANTLWPSVLIYQVLPMFRAYARFGVVVFLCLAVLAGVGAAWLWRRPSRAAKLSAVALVAMAVVELSPLPPFRWRDVLPTPAHRFLAEGPQPVRVMDCVPPSRWAEKTFFFRYAPKVSILAGIEDCGDPGFFERLGARDFTHLLVRRPSPLGDWLASRPDPDLLVRIGDFSDALLYEVEPGAAPTIETSFSSGFHWREYKEARSYRWMEKRGRLTVTNRTSEDLRVALEVELHSFPSPRRIDISLDGVEFAEIEVATDVRVYPLGAVNLSPGAHTLELISQDPAVVPDETLDNGDERKLTVALWSWRWAQEEAPL